MVDTAHPLIGGYELIDGQFVSQRVRQIVQAIVEYCPEIEVKWVPPSARKEGQAAYRLIHRAPGHEPYIMMTIRRDEDMDERILQKIIANDQRWGTTPLSEFEAWEAAQEAVKRQEWLDKLEEAHDIAHHVYKSRLHKYDTGQTNPLTGKRVIIEDRGGII